MSGQHPPRGVPKRRTLPSERVTACLASALLAVVTVYPHHPSEAQESSEPFEWVDVDSGPFTWGRDDLTRHVEYDFLIMRYEVTNAEFAAYMSEAVNDGSIWIDTTVVMGNYAGDGHFAAGPYLWYDMALAKSGYNFGLITWDEESSTFIVEPGYENHPVVSVSWFAARAFARHYGLSLPTLNEWVKAARGNTGYDYPWGDELSGDKANFLNSGDPYDNGTTPVGFYSSTSPYGAYDMAGNVWEWINEPTQHGSRGRYNMGGSWDNGNTTALQSWMLHGDYATLVRYNLGFRCVKKSLDVRSGARLEKLDVGPSYLPTDVLKVRSNETKYLYLGFTQDGSGITSDEHFYIRLSIPNTVEENYAVAGLAEPGVLRIGIRGDGFETLRHVYVFHTPDEIYIGNTVYEIDTEPIRIVVQPEQGIEFKREWDVFAGGSAGVVGRAGSFGTSNVSISAARLSVKGEAGMGLKLETRDNKNVSLDRRLEAGVSVGLAMPKGPEEVPVPDFVEGEAEVAFRVLVGQKFDFSAPGLNASQKKIAEAGFMLETLALGGVASPTVGPVIFALVQQLNALGGVQESYQKGLAETYFGLGVEGSAGVGLEFGLSEILENLPAGGSFAGKFKSFELNVASLSAGFSFMGKGTLMHKPDPAGKAAGIVIEGIDIELQQAVSADLSLMELGIEKDETDDFIELGSGNFGLFDVGVTQEIGLKLSLSKDFDPVKFEAKLSGGEGRTLLGSNRATYHSTTFEFDQPLLQRVGEAGSGLAGMLGSGQGVPLGGAMMQDIGNTVSTLLDDVAAHPITVTVDEKRSRGKSLDLEIDLGLSIGAGAGLSLGVQAGYADEIEFTRKQSQIYGPNDVYLIASAEYDSTMEEMDFSKTVGSLFSGVMPLISSALKNVFDILEETLAAGKDLAIALGKESGGAVGRLVGKTYGLGKWTTGSFSLSHLTKVELPFETPSLKQTYRSSSIRHLLVTSGGQHVLRPTSATMVAVGQGAFFGFAPASQSTSVDSLAEPVELEMLASTDSLVARGFAPQDLDRVAIYHYDADAFAWTRMPTERRSDTLSASVRATGIYTLGIELTDTRDATAPTIIEFGPAPNQVHGGFPEIFVRVEDDRYGSGIDLSRTYMKINGQKVGLTFTPSDDRIAYQTSSGGPFPPGLFEVDVVVYDYAGNTTSASFSMTLTLVGVELDKAPPKRFGLDQNHPNPFSNQTRISFSVPVRTKVELNLYDAVGRYLGTLLRDELPAGRHEADWRPPREIASGVYFYQLKSGDHVLIRPMVLVR